MSPLVRSLLALAVVALLQGACAVPRFDCTTLKRGITDEGHPVSVKVPPIPPYVQDAVVDIPNGCKWYEHRLGEEVKVCDVVAPDVSVPDGTEYTPATVHRTFFWPDHLVPGYAAPVFVTQYCRFLVQSGNKIPQ